MNHAQTTRPRLRPWRVVGACLPLIGLALLGGPALARTTRPADVPGWLVDEYGVSDGLPTLVLTGMTEGPDGAIWVSTFDGLVRLDGAAVVTWNRTSDPVLPGNRFVDLTSTPDGAIWAVEEQGGIVRWQAGTFRAWLPDRDRPGAARSLARLGGRLWFGTTKGMARFENGEVRAWRTEAVDGPVTAFVSDGRDGLWVATEGDKVWHVPATGPAQLFRWAPEAVSLQVHALHALDAGRALVGADRRGVYLAENGHLRAVVPPLGQDGDRPFRELFLRQDGTLLGRTDWRWWRMRPPFFTPELELDGLLPTTDYHWRSLDAGGDLWRAGPGGLYRGDRKMASVRGHLRAIHLDLQGNVWFAASGDGLRCLRRATVQTLPVAPGADPIVEAVALGPDGRLWALDHGGRLLVRSDDGSLRAPEGLWGRAPAAESLLWSREGHLLLGVLDGVALADGDRFRLAELPWPEALERQVQSLHQDARDRLWLAARGGLSVMEGGVGQLAHLVRRGDRVPWRQVRGPGGVQIEGVRAMVDGPRGTLVATTARQGLVLIDDAGPQLLDRQGGLSSARLRGLLHGDGDVWWIGTEDAGLCRVALPAGVPLAAVRAQCLDSRQGLLEDAVHALAQDGHGRLWLSGNRGLSIVAARDVAAVLNGQARRVLALGLDQRHGMTNRELNGRLRPALARDAQGRLWLPSQAGVVAADPDRFAPPQPPPVAIASVAVGARARQPPLGVVDVPRGSPVTIAWTAPEFEWPDQLRFRHRLRPGDAWSLPSPLRSAQWAELPPGDHTFEIQAGLGGVWSPSARTRIRRPPQLTETAAFPLMLMVLTAGLVAGGAHVLLRRQRERGQALERLVAERTRELQDRNVDLERQSAQLQAQKAEISRQAVLRAELAQAKDRFVANLSHELRTPLMLVQAPLERLSSHGDGEQERLLDLTRKNARRLRELVDQLLDTARVDAGTVRAWRQPMDLTAFVAQEVAAFLPAAEQAGLTLTLHRPDQAFRLAADPDLLAKIVGNLLGNALRFTPAGGRIDVRVAQAGMDRVRVEVRDTGIGIDPALHDRVFERFFQVGAGDDRPAEGAGIGLSLVAELVELHGGDSGVSSAPGQGSTFWFTLPLTPTDDGPEPGPDADEDTVLAPEPVPRDGRSPVVLIVEDHADLRLHLAGELATDFDVLTAEGGEAALAILRERRPDVLVCDVMMPGMDGLTLCRRLRADPATRELPVVLISAKGTPEDVRAGRQVAQDYLVKPFEVPDLRKRVWQLLPDGLAPAPPLSPASEERTAADERFLQRLDAIIAARLDDEQLAVHDLAKAMALSPRQLQREINRLTGLAPVAYLREARVRHAEIWLGLGQFETVSEVAAAVGMSPRNLRRFYAERTGRPPSEDLRR